MRNLFLLLVCGLFAANANAQFGITALYQSSQDDFTSITTPSGGILQNGYEIAADYWFRLPTKRIEFMPTVSFGKYDNVVMVNPNASGFAEPLSLDYNATEIGFQFKTNFYLFDFGTDCNCPTWGKQGPALHKGFFIQLAPGVSHFRVNSTFTELDRTQQSNHTFFNLGIGAGIDFGLSNLVTITPLVSYRYNLNGVAWNAFDAPCDQCDQLPTEGRISALQAGIRVGIRLDERRY